MKLSFKFYNFQKPNQEEFPNKTKTSINSAYKNTKIPPLENSLGTIFELFRDQQTEKFKYFYHYTSLKVFQFSKRK